MKGFWEMLFNDNTKRIKSEMPPLMGRCISCNITYQVPLNKNNHYDTEGARSYMCEACRMDPNARDNRPMHKTKGLK